MNNTRYIQGASRRPAWHDARLHVDRSTEEAPRQLLKCVCVICAIIVIRQQARVSAYLSVA